MLKSKNPALTALKRKLSASSIRTDLPTRKQASMDNARLSSLPEAVIQPQSDAEIGYLLQIANRYKIPVTPRGAGSATTGATTPLHGGWVLDLSHWKKIRIDASSGMAHVEAGAVIEKINQAAEKKGWFYPPDPSSKKHATIGGCIANNAGGLRGAKYGVTRDYILGLEGFLPTGEPVKWGGALKKYASGYNLKDLWIGSEGTLGVVTRAVLKLVPKPQSTWTTLVAFRNEADALRAAASILRSNVVPSIMEFLDRQTIACANTYMERPMFPDLPQASLLLIELDGHKAAIREERKKLLAAIERYALKSQATDNPAKAEKLWAVRRQCSQAMFQMGNTKLNEDVVIPQKNHQKLLKYTLDLKKETGLATPTFGHVADGNFHVHIMYDRNNPKEAKQAEKGVNQLMCKVIELDGVITGEHGIGLAKSPFLRLQHNAAEIRMMQAIKAAYDPNNIMNPGKIFEPFEIWNHEADYSVRFPWQKR